MGRSGTVTTISTLYRLLVTACHKGNLTELENYLGNTEAVTLTELVLQLRRVRHPWMVEGLYQYLLAHQGTLEILKTNLRDNHVTSKYNVKYQTLYFIVSYLDIVNIDNGE